MTTVKCPQVDCVLGRVPDRKAPNGTRQCPLCLGRGFLNECLPQVPPDKTFPSDLGMTRPTRWRPASGLGSVHGLPTLTGEAIATDGVLLVIRLPDNKEATVHLASWVKVKEEKKPRETRASPRKERKPLFEEVQFE